MRMPGGSRTSGGLPRTNGSGSRFGRGRDRRRYSRRRSRTRDSPDVNRANRIGRSVRTNRSRFDAEPLSARTATLREHDPATRPRSALTMIVRDEEKNLPHCLESVRGFSTRSWSSIPAAPTGPRRSPGRLGRRSSTSSGSMTSRRRGTRPGACDRRLCVLARCRRRGRAASSGKSCGRCCDWLASVARRTTQPAFDGAGSTGMRPVSVAMACVRRALRVRPEPGRHRRRDRRRSYPAVSASRGCPLDLSRSRADLAVPAAGQGSGALDRFDRAAYGLCRPGPAGQEARPRHQDPQARAGRPARRSVRAVQPGGDRRRAAATGTRRSVPQRSLAGSAPTDSIVRKLFALIARAHQMMGDSQAGTARPAPRG